jgi:phosphoglycolate phosphatase
MDKKVIILFDLDGTLIDSTDAITECFYHSFKEFDFNFKGNIEDIKKEIGYPLEDMYETFGVPFEKIADFIVSYKKEYRKISQKKTYLLPKAVETIKLASTFARIAIVTTKTTEYTIPLLEYMGIMHYFETIIGRQEVQNPKPHPEPIFKCLENMNLKPTKNIFMIGDTKLDLIAANRANISNIGVLCGYGTLSQLQQYTDTICNDSFEAVTHIEKYFNSTLP